MGSMLGQIVSINGISALLVVVLIVSVVQGVSRGASNSARHLFFFVMEGIITVASILSAWLAADTASPWLSHALKSLNIEIPNRKLGGFTEIWYTLITSVRDFPLLRFGLLFIICYPLCKFVLYTLADRLVPKLPLPAAAARPAGQAPGPASWIVGGGIGAVVGISRTLMIVAALFIAVSLAPQKSLVRYIEDSRMYQEGATHIIKPVAGDWIDGKLPLVTKSLQQEFEQILRRKYEVIDHRIPQDIGKAAKEITRDSRTDEEKAYALYRWVGTRVQYDWDKVELYDKRKVWKEQSPEDTFRTREGVCIDYSRLYAVMGRAVGLKTKVITGLGYDGRGGYGPHAWNEVYLPEDSKWIPLDATWLSSGGDWFNPPHFYDSHVKDV